MKPGAKRALLKRFNYECLYCSTELNDKSMTVEHLIPRSWGGATTKSNVALACVICNNDRGAKDLYLYIDSLPTRDQVYAKLQYVQILECIKYTTIVKPKVKEPEKPKYNKFWSNLGYGVKL